ncbi:MAG: hypothetical protein A3K10_17775 [Bacteroidetes bacterium RIFCSPLOWO2_12_FULL_31_6]|nr:MAG: hypothetical protein A3K10_17775 [Bacteroidetes bacterium RIFCSPLOWO2_12_FULL_31_6]
MTYFKNILSSLLIVGIFALHPSLNKGETPFTYLQHFVYGNSLTISTNSAINKNLLEVKWICETQNITCKDLVVYKNGKQINDIPSERGKQKLIVFYNQNKIGEISQNKTTEKQAHQYNIELLSKNESLFFSGEIIGPSPYKGPPTSILSVASL